MTEITHRFVQAGRIRMHIAEAGSGPLVVLLHGFPETWYSWRHQLLALAAAGYHAVAPDQRGYGRTDQPDAVEDYTILHTVGDVIHLIDVLGVQQAVLAGHDWGGVVAWHAALMRPDVVRGVVSLSTPFQPHADGPHLAALRAGAGADYENYYSVYVQRPGVADKELGEDPRATVRRALYGASGEGYPWNPIVPAGGQLLDIWPEPNKLPNWLTEQDIDTVADDYARTGFTPALNWFRNFDRNWALTSPWHRSRRPRALRDRCPADFTRRPVTVGRGATVGAAAVLAPGVTIGAYALVSMGAVVVRDVPAHALVAGHPARQCGWACRCGHTLDEQHRCPACARSYIRIGDHLAEADPDQTGQVQP